MAQVNLDTASRLDIVCRKGDTFSLGIDFGVTIPIQGNDPEDASKTGMWKMQVRTSQNEESVDPVYNTVYNPSNLIDTANTDFKFEIQEGDATGSKLVIKCDATDMSQSGEYVYDLQNKFIDGLVSETKTYLYGKFTVVEDITNS
jgi:hypothetical protein